MKKKMKIRWDRVAYIMIALVAFIALVIVIINSISSKDNDKAQTTVISETTTNAVMQGNTQTPAPTQAETPAPTVAPTQAPTEPEVKTPDPVPTPTGESIPHSFDINALSAEKQFYANSVFIGDSVMLGFEYYNGNNPDNLPGARFLAAPNYSSNNALNQPQDSSIHPTYNGVHDYVWNSLTRMNADKAIVFMGINDLNIGGLDATYDRITTVMSNIKSSNPGMKVYFLSTTPIFAGHDSGQLSNSNIVSLNSKMKQYCASNGYGFIDIHSYMVDSIGTLDTAYCSDEFVHINYAGYEMWTNALLEYAAKNK